MHRKILLGAFLLAIATSACLGTPAPIPAGSMHPTTVRITTLIEGEAGSGVVIAPNWVLTCKHCLPATACDGVPVTHQIPHPSLDLALLFAPGVNGSVEFGPVPQLHDELASYGFHLGDFLLRTDGHAGKPGMMSAPIIMGASGGPVMDSQGRLVGVNEALYMVQGPMGGGIPIPHVSRYTPIDEAVVEWITAKMQAHEKATEPVASGR